MGNRRLRVAAQSAAVGAALAASLTACSSGGRPSNVIDVSNGSRGGAWSVPSPGWHTLQVSNQGTDGAEIENTGPGAVNPITIDFGSGRYALLCVFDDVSPQRGPTVTVAGHASVRRRSSRSPTTTSFRSPRRTRRRRKRRSR